MPDQTEQLPADPATERRLATAFGALATTEVPSSAPRPPAPRPVPRVDHTRRRRLGLAGGGVLVAAAAVVVALVVGGEVDDARQRPTAPPGTDGPVSTSAPAPSTSTSVSTPVTTPGTTASDPVGAATAELGQAQAAAAFVLVAGDNHSDVVQVPGGWEGADLDAGTIRFWHAPDGLTWTVSGTSNYPADFRGDGQTTWSATVGVAALLDGMQHATFLVRSDGFTGDGTGAVIDYTDGDNGWGVVKAGSDGDLHPTGNPVESDRIGLMYEGDLVGGLLQTVDCSRSSPDNASCGLSQYQVVKYWRWDGTRFVVEHRTGPAS